MLAAKIPLQMISQYEHVVFPENGTIDERKTAIQVCLNNCAITRDIGTDLMNKIADQDLREDICKMRAAALEAIPLGEAALRADVLEDFNGRVGEFLSQYGNLISSVKNYLWDYSDSVRDYLWPLTEEVM
jgi:hypothetical protein